MDIKARLKGLRCQPTFAHENMHREIISLREISLSVPKDKEVLRLTPRVRSIISTMQSFQNKGERLMEEINELVGDLVCKLTVISADPRLSKEMKEEITKDSNSQMDKQAEMCS